MIRPIDIRLNAAHPDIPLAEAVTYTGAPSTVLIRGVPGNCGRWAITAVFVAATFPDGSTSTRTAVQSANGVWVATLPATATSGRTAHGLRILADGADENGEAVGGYILGVADFAVASLGIAPAPQPGETSWQMLYFDAVPGVLRKGDVTKIDGVLKLYNGTAWEPFANVPAPSTANPQMDGTAAPGTSASYARGDHVHPTDTSRMAATATGADIPLNPSPGAPNLNSVVNTLTTQISTHENNTAIHVTSVEKATWNGKQDALTAQQLANIAAVPNKLDKSGGTMTGPLTEKHGLVLGKEYSNDFDGFRVDASGNAEMTSHAGGSATIGAVISATQEMPNKANRAANPTAGNLAALDASGNPTDAGWTADNLARYALSTKTIDNNAVTLDDRAMNAVAVSSALASLTINFPTATSGRVRDFGLRLSVASGITTAPELVLPQGVTCENADGEVPEIGADGAATILYFTETASGVFLVKGEVVTAIS